MDNLLLSFRVVAPLMIYMATGLILRTTGIITEKTSSQLSQIVFCVLVPALCIDNLRSVDIRQAFSEPTALYMALAVIVVFLLTFLLVPLFCRDKARCGVLVHGIFRSNDGVFGLAVGAALLGEGNLGLMVVCIAITIPLYNLLAVLTMEYFRGGKPNFLHVLKKIVTNLIVIGCAVGVLLSVFGIELPTFLSTPLTGFSKACAPIGFLALGGALTFSSLSENRVALSLVSLIKLIVMPALVLSVFYLIGMRGDAMLVGAIIFGAPSALTVYPMACSMGGDEKLAGGIVAVTSALSLVTMFLIIFLFKQLGIA